MYSHINVFLFLPTSLSKNKYTHTHTHWALSTFMVLWNATLGVGLVEIGRGSWSLWVLPLTWGTQVSPRSYLCFPALVSWGP